MIFQKIHERMQVMKITTELLHNQPEKVVKPLFMHQRAMVHCMHEREQLPILKPLFNQEVQLNWGVLGDRVGSGKSIVLLSLISEYPRKETIITNDTYEVGRIIGSYYGFSRETITKKINHEIDTNILIMPHSIKAQWKRYIHEFTPDMKVLWIDKKKGIENICIDTMQGVDLIMITSTMYKHIIEHFNLLFSTTSYRFNRVIVDEVDSIRISRFNLPKARFTWFVTSSIKNIYTPEGNQHVLQGLEIELIRTKQVLDYRFAGRNREITEKEKSLQRKIDTFVTIQGIVSRGTVTEILSSSGICTIDMAILQNDDETIDASIKLLPVKCHVIQCMPRYNYKKILIGLVSSDVIDALDSEEYEKAKELSGFDVKTQTNIIEEYRTQWNQKKDILTRRYEYDIENKYITEEEKTTITEKYETAMKKIDEKLEMIESRIHQDTCLICFSNAEQKIIVNCCQNTYCLNCISRWLLNHSNCPLCRNPLHESMLNIVGTPTVEPKEKLQTKKQALMNLVENLMSKQDSHILIFTNSYFHAEVMQDLLSYSTSHLKGTGAHIENVIRNFRTGSIQLLILDHKIMAQGLNLEMATDVILFNEMDTETEMQCIGRAQRFGRTTQLNVWKLTFEK